MSFQTFRLVDGDGTRGLIFYFGSLFRHITLSEAYAEQTGGSKKGETKEGGGGGNSTGVYPTKLDFDENGQWVRSSDR